MCTVALQGGAARVTVNQQFSDLFCPAAELSARVLAGGVAPPLAYAALVAPEDRLDFLEAMARYLFGTRGDVELSQIVRMRDCFDAPFLAVARLRVLTLAGGAYLATMLTVTPAPSSKYIRGGNREELGPSWLGLNFAEARFRTRQPSAAMSELGGRFVSENTGAEPVRRFLAAGAGGGKAALAEAIARYRSGAAGGGGGGGGRAASAAAAMETEPVVGTGAGGGGGGSSKADGPVVGASPPSSCVPAREKEGTAAAAAVGGGEGMGGEAGGGKEAGQEKEGAEAAAAAASSSGDVVVGVKRPRSPCKEAQAQGPAEDKAAEAKAAEGEAEAEAAAGEGQQEQQDEMAVET